MSAKVFEEVSMMFRKLLAVFVVVLLTALPAAAAEKTLGLVISTLNNPFFVSLKQGARERRGRRE
jgi:ribose transport system substrate-binding protein